jgi:SAM-dependent methyltransferase
LGKQALANNFQLDRVNVQEYPLATNYCEECSHLQLTHSVNPKTLFSNYLYVSGTTKTLKDYFHKFAEKIDMEYDLGKNELSKKRIIDVACNDGTQLDYFKKLGWATMGIDPAINLHGESSKNHFVICDFLNRNHGNFLISDVLIAQNVLAHTNNPLEFLQIAARIAKTILIQTSQAFMVERNEFDTTYHEHVSYFSELSMFKLAQRAGLKLTKVEIMPIHGDSFLFTLEKDGGGVELQEPNCLEYEKVKLFGENATEILKDIDATIIDHKKRGRVVVGYGAAAKGMTV